MPFFFDTLIISYLLAVLLLFILLIFISLYHDRQHKKFWEYRHPFWRTTILILLATSWLTVFYGSFIEPGIITVKRQAIDLEHYANNPLQIALISDLHVGPYKKERLLKEAIKKIEKLAPDLVLIAGDIIYDKPDQARYLSPLETLAGQFPVFAVLGDHDYNLKWKNGKIVVDEAAAKAVTDILLKDGIPVLKNEILPLERHKVWLIGVDDVKTQKTDLSYALNALEATAEKRILSSDNRDSALSWPKIILTHNPDIMFGPRIIETDLVLAGHTHGGQIRLPFIGPIARIPDYLGQKYDKGLFTFNRTKLFITSGLGVSGPRARLFNPPEIALITIY